MFLDALCLLGPTVTLTARPSIRLFHLVFESHDGRAGVPISEEKHEPASDIDTVGVDGLKALDPKRPIREATLATPNGPVINAADRFYAALARLKAASGLDQCSGPN